MGGSASSWPQLIREQAEGARGVLEREDEVREKILDLSRRITRLARKAIFKLHEGDVSGCRATLDSLKELVGELVAFKERSKHYYGGATTSALAEYVEAVMLFKYIVGEEPPGYEELGVEPEQYLLGLADFSGELRRLLVRHLSKGGLEEAERALALMEEVFKALSTMAVPEALAPGLRHKVDVLRALIETSARDLLYHATSARLEERMRNLLEKLAMRDEVPG